MYVLRLLNRRASTRQTALPNDVTQQVPLFIGKVPPFLSPQHDNAYIRRYPGHDVAVVVRPEPRLFDKMGGERPGGHRQRLDGSNCAPISEISHPLFAQVERENEFSAVIGVARMGKHPERVVANPDVLRIGCAARPSPLPDARINVTRKCYEIQSRDRYRVSSAENTVVPCIHPLRTFRIRKQADRKAADERVAHNPIVECAGELPKGHSNSSW